MWLRYHSRMDISERELVPCAWNVFKVIANKESHKFKKIPSVFLRRIESFLFFCSFLLDSNSVRDFFQRRISRISLIRVHARSRRISCICRGTSMAYMHVCMRDISTHLSRRHSVDDDALFTAWKYRRDSSIDIK